MRTYLVPVLIGVVGCAILAALGVWQLKRLAWKEGVLTEIEARIGASPGIIPERPDIGSDRFMPVHVIGDFDGSDIPVFLSHDSGPIYRLVAAMETEDGRRIMVDRGAIPGRGDPVQSLRTMPVTDVTVIGNLHWPDEVDGWTPEPDGRGVFFGRDVVAMAQVLETEPVLVVAREVSVNEPATTLLPVTVTGIPNNHLGYAIQWFGLAIVWAGMTFFLLWRIRKTTV